MSSVDPGLCSQQRWYGYLALARISNSPTVVANVLAGAALAGIIRPNLAVATVALALVLFYTAGMVLNDICDYAFDCIQRPERPLPAGIISRNKALGLTVGLFGIGSGLLMLLSWVAFLSGLGLISLIIGYDLWHKTNPLSPGLMAANRVMVYVTTFLAFKTSFSPMLLIAATLLGFYVVGLTYIAKCEYRPAFANYWPTGLLFLSLTYAMLEPTWAVLPFVVGLAAWISYSISFVYRKQGRSVGDAIGRLIAGMALYDALVLVIARAWLGSLLAIAAFGLTLFLQRYIKGT